ncbi:MAG: hypothetical protein JNK78_14640 [Planctomycetes bacterium]|nr:hypothetical protein [Planctomycetota bacterium]
MRRSSFAILVCVLFAACAQQLDCTLVYLKTGPRRTEVQGADLQKVMGGHLGNIQRLFREKRLLVAGPFGRQKSDAALRGIFVLDTDDREVARSLAESDPGVAAGVFALEYHAISTTAPLRECAAAELAADEAATKAGTPRAMGEGMRGYVLLTAESGDAAAAELAADPAVLWFATLDDDQAFVLLDARDQAGAKSVLGERMARLGAVRLDEWMATDRLAELPKMAR